MIDRRVQLEIKFPPIPYVLMSYKYFILYMLFEIYSRIIMKYRIFLDGPPEFNPCFSMSK